MLVRHRPDGLEDTGLISGGGGGVRHRPDGLEVIQ